MNVDEDASASSSSRPELRFFQWRDEIHDLDPATKDLLLRFVRDDLLRITEPSSASSTSQSDADQQSNAGMSLVYINMLMNALFHLLDHIIESTADTQSTEEDDSESMTISPASSAGIGSSTPDPLV